MPDRLRDRPAAVIVQFHHQPVHHLAPGVPQARCYKVITQDRIIQAKPVKFLASPERYSNVIEVTVIVKMNVIWHFSGSGGSLLTVTVGGQVKPNDKTGSPHTVIRRAKDP
jgi:hypothetical protein